MERHETPYGTPMGTLMRSIEWCYFQWPWVTSSQRLLVTTAADTEFYIFKLSKITVFANLKLQSANGLLSIVLISPQTSLW